jgi:hypothetical protein
MKPTNKVYPAGQVIFKEGDDASVAYIIIKGKIEISIQPNDKKIVLDTIGSGSCFGEMAPIVGGKRSATAITATEVKLCLLDAKTLEGIVSNSSPILRSIISTLINRVKKMNETTIAAPAVTSASSSPTITQDPIPQLGKLLDLMISATHPVMDERTQKWHLSYTEFFNSAIEITGLEPTVITRTLEYMAKSNIFTIDTKSDVTPLLLLDPKVNIKERINLITRSEGKAVTTIQDNEFELVTMEQLADLLTISKNVLYKKMLYGQFPESMFMFFRKNALDLFKKSGLNFFERYQVLPLRKVTTFAHLEFIERDKLIKVLNKLKTQDIATIVAYLNPTQRDMFLSYVSKNKVSDIAIEPVKDKISYKEFEIFEKKMISKIKASF